MEDWRRQRFDPPRGSADVGRWQVHLAVEAAERDAIRDHAPNILPGEHVAIWTELVDSAGEADVYPSLGVIAETSDQAEEEAVDAMRRIRANAASLQRLRSSSGISRPGGASPVPAHFRVKRWTSLAKVAMTSRSSASSLARRLSSYTFTTRWRTSSENAIRPSTPTL